ncbi:MAG: U32 family peptidase C-terminal domain-containing protein, partial [Acutalibacter sp.]|nr:U32 family peptidase C-terminal domain-containing protein [Acutalibacter sp.]
TPDRSQYTRKYEVVAVAEGREGAYIRLRERNRFFAGSTADVLQPGQPPFTARLEELYNQDWEPIASAPHAEMLVYWKTSLPVEPGAYLRVKKEP